MNPTVAGAPVVRSAAWVHQAVKAILQGAGASTEAADAMAGAVAEAQLRGVETHGLRRLGPYLTRLKSGGVNASAQPVITQHDAIVQVDGRNGIGHHVATVAACAVADAARQHGIALALVRNSNHFGFAGYYATMIARRRQVGIVTSNGQVCVAPEGGMRALLSNDPLAIAAPTGNDDEFLELDLATSITSRANIVAAAKSGKALPLGLAQDPKGMPTRDAKVALEGSLLAFGGAKGFALLFALEVITGVLCGGGYADQVSSKEDAPNAPEGTAHMMIAIDLDRAIGGNSFRARLDDLIARLAAMPVDPAVTPPIRYPGQRRWSLRRERIRNGIPLTPAELKDLDQLAANAGVSLPQADSL